MNRQKKWSGAKLDVAAGVGRREFLGGSLAAGAVLASSAATLAAAPLDDRYARGLAVLRQVGGLGFDAQLQRLAELSPEMARYTVEFGYGDLMSRPALDLPHRELCVVAALIAQGSVQPQLKYHMHGYLNVGGEPRELVELLILSVALCGFPGAIDALRLLRETLAERALPVASARAPGSSPEAGEQRYAEGLRYLQEIGVDLSTDQQLMAGAPELERWNVEFAAGEILARRVLSEKQKHLSAIAMLGAVGHRQAALRLHLRAALRCGVARSEIVEVLMQLSVYAGFPTTLNAFFVAVDVLKKDTGESASPELPVQRSEPNNVRAARGAAALAQTSAQSGEAVIRGFDDLAPVLGQMLLQHSYGDIFQRPQLTAKQRELAAVSAMAAVGTTASATPLCVHINAALNAGASQSEILEVLYNLLPYRGYPLVRQAVSLALQEFAKHAV